MGVITQTKPLLPHPNHPNRSAKTALSFSSHLNSITSMSQSFHQGIFSFSDGFERSVQQQQQQHIAQQSRRDKLRVQGFDPATAPPSLVSIDDGSNELPGYETGMLSEMFNFPAGGPSAAADLLENQMASNYRIPRPSPPNIEWYTKQQLVGSDNRSNRSETGHGSVAQHHISGMNADSAAAMQLFIMNPQARSPSPSPPPSSSTPLHMLLPNPSPQIQGFHVGGQATFGTSTIQPSQFSWPTGENIAGINNGSKIGGRVIESHGLSLSLSSSLQQLEAAKAAEGMRMEDGVFYFNQGGGPSPSSSSYPLKNLGSHPQQGHVGFGSLAVVNVLRNSKYRRAAQELLEEFCSVGRGQLKSSRHGKNKPTTNPNPNLVGSSGGGSSSASGAGGPQQQPASSSSKDPPPLSPSDRFEHQRRKSKLLSMHDEVDRRYNHYCEQMQMVVNSFDSVMGFGAAAPYTALAQKAMSRHFRCLKDAIAAQLKHTCDLLGEKDGAGSSSGVTKGETPRLRLLEQSLRQQKAFNQMGLMDQEAWRPQRGLPERSVNILRAWLFEHFLHPYPSDADKHLLARQTGLSRNQVSNWFINARVRLWKPMVEEMYQQESKDEEHQDDERERQHHQPQQHQQPKDNHSQTAQTTTPAPTAATTAGKRSEINAHDNDHSLHGINRHRFSENQVNGNDDSNNNNSDVGQIPMNSAVAHHDDDNPRGVMDDMCRISVAGDFGTTTVGSGPPLGSTRVRFGTTGDVSLTLGLRHAGNMPEKSRFSIRDFGGC
ncbi:BEL1-like homeodomain protein 4 [Magnolia sinica]|uniref:BEL1-like homeodomain protein 4 n=1 Tax=Magnolia sinica TaxID=86752 RepID=UPI002657CDC2|nr:BEL1-like homeodomain protein 4 [Magnolia sinica]XP_058069149.1 BEL1-like homeodomain protein 4 [Magnolia sinica]